jgi:hypothetical protein
MFLVTAHVPESAIKAVLQALTPFVPPNGISLFKAVPTPDDEDNSALQQLALKVVNLVRPKPNQSMRVKALRALLGGHDTWWNQGGEPDPALRNAIGAISKALKGVFDHDHPVKRLAVPRKNYFPGGEYKGTTYLVTPLGERVRYLLVAEGVLIDAAASPNEQHADA